jgi:hypothetical protein
VGRRVGSWGRSAAVHGCDLALCSSIDGVVSPASSGRVWAPEMRRVTGVDRG